MIGKGPDDSCINCVFWLRAKDPDGAYGTCRRDPPVYIVAGEAPVQARTHQSIWCGEYRRWMEARSTIDLSGEPMPAAAPPPDEPKRGLIEDDEP